MIRMESKKKKKKADMLSSARGVFQMQTPCRAAVGLQSTYAVQYNDFPFRQVVPRMHACDSELAVFL